MMLECKTLCTEHLVYIYIYIHVHECRGFESHLRQMGEYLSTQMLVIHQWAEAAHFIPYIYIYIIHECRTIHIHDIVLLTWYM